MQGLFLKMRENIDFEYKGKEEKKNGKNIIKEELIQSILSIKRQKEKEGKKEPKEIKLGRRLEQRSNPKLSEKILEHIITRYEIDNNKLPSKKELIDKMINFLGNIQKTPDNYNLKDNPKEIKLKEIGNMIGSGYNGKIYAFPLNEHQTKKKEKLLAYKKVNYDGRPYYMDIHIVSAVLLAYYDFQPKYYNHYFMEIGDYENKSRQRSFYNVQKIITGFESIVKNIRWYILFNFTNIKDQVHNLMKRYVNQEFIKIDIGPFNSERKRQLIETYLSYFKYNIDVFYKLRKEVKNELNKILIINEEFLIYLIIFRAKRGCINIYIEDLATQFDCISSSYKVLKITRNDNFYEMFKKKYKNTFYNKHHEMNIALSWMLFYLWKGKIFGEKEYNEYINKFNKKSETFKEYSKKIRNGNFSELIFQGQEKEREKNEREQKEKEKIKIEDEKQIYDQFNLQKIKKEELEKKNEEEIKDDIKLEKEEIKEIDLINLSNRNNKNKEKEEYSILEGNKEDSNIINKNNNEIHLENNKNDEIKINNFNNKDIKNINGDEVSCDNKNESLCYEVINLEDNNDILVSDQLNLNNNYIKSNINRNRNNFIHNIDKTKTRSTKNKKNSKLSWFCCGDDATDVKD